MVGLKVLKRKHEDRDEQIRVAEVPISGALNVQKDCDPYVSVEIALRGLNVKPYFADLLVSGVKDIECRKYILGTHGTARTTFVIRSKGADKGAVPAVLGMVKFHGCSEYTSRQQYEGDRCRHQIDPASAFEWTGDTPLYAWHVDKCYAFKDPIPVEAGMPFRNMIGWVKPVTLKVRVRQSEKLVIMETFKDD